MNKALLWLKQIRNKALDLIQNITVHPKCVLFALLFLYPWPSFLALHVLIHFTLRKVNVLICSYIFIAWFIFAYVHISYKTNVDSFYFPVHELSDCAIEQERTVFNLLCLHVWDFFFFGMLCCCRQESGHYIFLIYFGLTLYIP